MLYFSIPYEIQTVVKKESSLTGKSVRKILIEKLWGETIEKNFSPALRANLSKLEEIKALRKNWNGNNSKPISKKIIKKAKTLIIDLEKQPQIFPTANDSIQIEYDGENNSYLELQITKKNKLSYYKVDKNGVESTGFIRFSPVELNNLVGVFYE
ncbi:hypothetical protein [uncultured Treponema sp.]|uniref:hypothetical protein n=1 Tax=uncultured Treponema sp. TaxID=162155 RepID=UPI0025E60BD1|nr:hypothetical protein [uncultured Treponema sp.]